MKMTRRLSGIVITAIVLGGSLVAWGQRQALSDWWVLRDYEPGERIAALADNTKMTDEGKKLFYVHDPQLSEKQQFQEVCDIGEASIVLGCYISRQHIYILDVQDGRLSGIHEVTAAHEMLHAAYERLSRQERQRVDGMTAAFFETLADERIVQTVERYRARDPSVVLNELHSILGTEVWDLSPELEAYYQRYFNDRRKIVAYMAGYEQEFTSRRDRVAAYDEQLSGLRTRIDTAKTSLEHQSSAIESERRRLDGLLANGQTEDYNAAVSGFNALVRAYNNELAAARQLIEDYNQLVEARNAVATEEQELIEAIDSRSVSETEE